MRSSSRLLPLVAFVTTTACFGYRPVETAPNADARVQVVLSRASTLTTVSTTGAIGAATGVREAQGIIESITPDTVALVVGELHTSRGRVRSEVGTLLLIPSERIARYERKRFRPVKTAVVGLAVVSAFLILKQGLADAFVFLPAY